MPSKDATIEIDADDVESLLDSDRVLVTARRLVEIEKMLASGDYTVDTLFDYDRAYQEYLQANIRYSPPSLLKLIKEWLQGKQLLPTLR